MCVCIYHCSVMAITVGTYNLPPFSMNEDREHIGMATEAIQTLLKRADIKNIQFIDYPLARGLAELRSGRIDIFYPYVGIEEEHSDQYILLGPIAKYSVALFVRKDYKQEVSLAAMQQVIVGAERGSIEDVLIHKHVLHIEKATGAVSCLRMVLAERVTACAIGTLPGQYVAAINNLAPKLQFSETGDSADMYVALRARLAPEILAKLQNSFEELKRENYFIEQQKAYEKRFALFLKTLS